MNFDEVLRGTYKGIPFLMTSGSVAGGNKNIVHSYPNSNRQTVENLGQTPRSFPLTILLSSDGYAAKRDALLKVLEEGMPGPLVHPLHGRIENVLAGPYTLAEDFTNLGSGSVTVTFYISNGPGVPQAAGVTVSAVAKANGSVSAAMQDNFGKAFLVTPSFLGGFAAATSLVSDASKAFKTSQKPLDAVDTFISEADTLAEEAAALVMAPVNLALRLTAMFEQATSVFDEPASAFTYFKGFFGFGNNGSTTAPVTAAQLQAADNKTVFDSAMNVQALGYAYLSAVQVDYATVDDVEAVAEALESQFVVASETAGVNTATRESLLDLRQLALKFLDEAKLTARRVISVTTRPTTARLLAFQYYGNDDQGETIAGLNSGNVSNLSGIVKVLTG